jgi:hypothetical protein
MHELKFKVLETKTRETLFGLISLKNSPERQHLYGAGDDSLELAPIRSRALAEQANVEE